MVLDLLQDLSYNLYIIVNEYTVELHYTSHIIMCKHYNALSSHMFHPKDSLNIYLIIFKLCMYISLCIKWYKNYFFVFCN